MSRVNDAREYANWLLNENICIYSDVNCIINRLADRGFFDITTNYVEINPMNRVQDAKDEENATGTLAAFFFFLGVFVTFALMWIGGL